MNREEERKIGWAVWLHAALTSDGARLMAIMAAIGVSLQGLLGLHRRPQPSYPPVESSAPAYAFPARPEALLASAGPAVTPISGHLTPPPRAAQPVSLRATEAARPDSSSTAEDSARAAAPHTLPSAGYGRFSTRGRRPTGSLAGGAGLSGGIGQDFFRPLRNPGGSSGLEETSSAEQVQGTRLKRAVPSGSSASKGGAIRRLSAMERSMSIARGDSSEAAGAVHAREWSGASPGGKSLSGSGVSEALGRSSAFSPEEGGDFGNPIEPVSAGRPDFPAAVPSVGNGVNVTPYQGAADAARIALLAAAGLLLAAFFLGMAALHAQARFAAYTAMAAATAAASIGLILTEQGQAAQGGIFVGAGALLACLSYTAAQGDARAAKAAETVRERAAAVP